MGRQKKRSACLVAGLAVMALAMSTSQAPATGLSPVSGAAPLKIVAFGTSLTQRGGWQQPLAEGLSACLHRPVTVDKIARSGASSDWGLEHVGEVVAARPDIVLVEFYANDAAINRFMTVGRSRANIAAIYDRLKSGLPGARIIVTQMNPILGLRGALRPFLSSYIAAHLEEARRRGLEYVDYSPGWSALSDEALAAAIPDGSHPEPAVASKIVTAILVPTLCKPAP